LKVFHCTHCEHLVFFENATCVRCQHTLAYLQDRELVGALNPLPDGKWQCIVGDQQPLYRLCDNYARESVCNWAIPEQDPHSLCYSCRFTHVLPDLGQPANRTAWYKLEVAKRRLLYTLVRLGAAPISKADDSEKGLAFAFLADTSEVGTAPILTGHANGTITINVAEADDVERERRRAQLHEPYRALLGHFRHESGHYYWDRLIKDGPALETFRELSATNGRIMRMRFTTIISKVRRQTGRAILSPPMPRHIPGRTGQKRGLTIFTSSIRLKQQCGLALRPHRSDEPKLKHGLDPTVRGGQSFDQLLESWFPLTYILNNLNRGLGLPDGYPFVLSPSAIDKLRFVHSTVR
jgi:hypothetical protein